MNDVARACSSDLKTEAIKVIKSFFKGVNSPQNTYVHDFMVLLHTLFQNKNRNAVKLIISQLGGNIIHNKSNAF